LQLPFFHEAPPKSTGRELFTPTFAAQLIADGEAAGASAADIVATATALTAASIADQYARFIPEPVAEVLLSGGGARNPTLCRGIANALDRMSASRPCGWAGATVDAFDVRFFDAEAKEAVAFALLGYLHLTGRAGNVPSATGARAPRILGALTPAVSGP
jgi:anhydro-N-acetylmuramic acid kinase